MLAKKTSKNQLTLPRRVADRFPGVDYFDVQVEDGRILLVPVRPERLAQVQARMSEMGLSERDVSDALEWARRQSR